MGGGELTSYPPRRYATELLHVRYIPTDIKRKLVTKQKARHYLDKFYVDM